jgi:hypothetical protein
MTPEAHDTFTARITARVATLRQQVEYERQQAEIRLSALMTSIHELEQLLAPDLEPDAPQNPA